MTNQSSEPSQSTFNQSGQTVLGNQTNIAGDLHTTYHYQLDPQASILDKPDADLFWLTAGRKEELAQLDQWYDAVLNDQRGNHPRAVVLTGPAGIGKREIIQRWCADLQNRDHAPLIAQSTYLPSYYDDSRQETHYATQPRLQTAWAAYAPLLRARYAQAELLGGRGWLALAAQLLAHSPHARAAGANATPSPTAPDAATLRRQMNELFVAALSDGPLVLVIDQVDNAPPTLQLLIGGWTKSLYNLPFLLVLVLDHPHPLHDSTPHEQESDWLRWLRQAAAPYATRSFPTLHIGSLRRQAVEALLSADSAAYASELHSLTAGVPALLRELLRHWEQQGLAHHQLDGRWRLDAHSLEIFPGALYERYIEAPLHACAACAQELGFAVNGEQLLDWLNYAVWEGDAFTDEALAHAVGQAGDALEAFRELLDEVLTRNEDDPQREALLVELDDLITLPTADLDRPMRGLVRYRFDPPLLARILYWRQSEAERNQRGLHYIQALIDAYHPFEVQIAPLLIHLAQRLGRHADAARFQGLIAPPADLDRAQLLLATLRTLATDPPGQQHFVRTVLDFFATFYGKVHPRPFISLLEEALHYAHTLQQTSNQARLLHNLGLVYADLGEKERALALYNQALPLRRQVGDIGGEAYTLTSIGNVYSVLGEKAQALALYSQALPLWRKVSDIGGEATTLTGLGNVYADLGETQQALALYNQARRRCHQVGDIGGEATILTQMGPVYADLGETQQALALYNQALSLRHQVGDIHGEATTLNNLGVVYQALGEKEQALALYQQALLLLRKVGNLRNEAVTLTHLGTVYADLGEKEQALALYQQALLLLRKAGDIGGEATTLTGIGNVYADLGEKEQALALYQQALPLWRKAGDIGSEATTLTGMGHVYADLGEKAQALTFYQQALPMLRKVGDLRREAHTLAGMGNVYLALGEKGQAQVLYQQALHLSRKVGDIGSEATTLTRLGDLYVTMDQPAQARTCWQQALPLLEKARPPHAAQVRQKLAALDQDDSATQPSSTP